MRELRLYVKFYRCIFCVLFIVTFYSRFRLMYFFNDRKALPTYENILSASTKIRSLNASIEFIPVAFIFTKAGTNIELQDKFQITVDSLLRFASLGIHFYIIGEEDSQNIARTILTKASDIHNAEIKITNLDIWDIYRNLHGLLEGMQDFISVRKPGYYKQTFFSLSLYMHYIMPQTLDRVIMLDSDLKFNEDIRFLYDHFLHFKEVNIIGMARENQPVYRKHFATFREKSPGTRVGDPPPHGLTGFNEGVLMLHLDRMRKSKIYNYFLEPLVAKNLTQKYFFRNFLGGQDYMSLLSMEQETIFYILPCGWNRQLCRYHDKNGYQEVFWSYYICEGPIYIYHGNCNTTIPTLEWEKHAFNL